MRVALKSVAFILLYYWKKLAQFLNGRGVNGAFSERMVSVRKRIISVKKRVLHNGQHAGVERFLTRFVGARFNKRGDA